MESRQYVLLVILFFLEGLPMTRLGGLMARGVGRWSAGKLVILDFLKGLPMTRLGGAGQLVTLGF